MVFIRDQMILLDLPEAISSERVEWIINMCSAAAAADDLLFIALSFNKSIPRCSPLQFR